MNSTVNMTEIAKNSVAEIVYKALGTLVSLEKIPTEALPPFTVEIPASSANGDFSCNVALVSAKVLHKSPSVIGALIAEHIDLSDSCFEKAEVKMPGFINFFVGEKWYSDVVKSVNQLKENYGRTNFGEGKRVLVEFVSANPTGPMHIGNARGGALGDTLASLLEFAGYSVEREFYVNDAGNQINKFGLSLEVRYLQHFGQDIELPEEAYKGQDIVDHVAHFVEIYGDKYLNVDSSERQKALVSYALPLNVKGLEEDLLKYKIKYDTWFRESVLHESGAVAEIIEKIKATGYTYEKDGALWFESSHFGDDMDRVLVRENGIPTYFVPDIAYHYNKLVTRNFDIAIDILGADHHGYIERMKAALTALGIIPERLQIIIMQMVMLVRNGETIKLSKRSGKAITLSTLLEEVPIDAARFFFNLRDANTHLDFDLDLAVEESSKNPVFYVQYAHARINSLILKLMEDGVTLEPDASYVYTEESEKALVRFLAQLPTEIDTAAMEYCPARLTRYVEELAKYFHKFYDACKLRGEDPAVMQSRLALVTAVKTVIKNILTLLKVTAPDKM